MENDLRVDLFSLIVFFFIRHVKRNRTLSGTMFNNTFRKENRNHVVVVYLKHS